MRRVMDRGTASNARLSKQQRLSDSNLVKLHCFFLRITLECVITTSESEDTLRPRHSANAIPRLDFSLSLSSLINVRHDDERSVNKLSRNIKT